MVVQAAIGEDPWFDPLPLEKDGGTSAEIDIGRSEIVETLVIARVLVVLDKGPDLRLQVAGQVIMFEQDAVLERLVPALDLALGLGMAWSAPDVLHAPILKPLSQIIRKVGGTIVRQQPRPVHDRHLIEPAGRQRQVECFGHIAGPHRGAQLPGDDEAREIVQHGREIVPSPASDLQGGEIGLPQLVGRGGLVPELVGCLDDDVGWAGDEIVCLEQAID